MKRDRVVTTCRFQEDDLDRYCHPIGVWERTQSRSRNTRCEAIEVAFEAWEGASRPDTLLARCIERLTQRVLAGRGAPIRVGISFQPPSFATPYHVPPRAPAQNTSSAMAAELERIAKQSGDGVDLFSGTVMFRICAVWPLGEVSGGEGSCANNLLDAIGTVRARSYCPVVNPHDAWCLARAVVLGLAERQCRILYGAGSAEATTNFQNFCITARAEGGAAEARQLLEMAGLPLDMSAYGIREAARIQDALNERLGANQVRLVIFEREHACRILWKSPARAAFNLCLLLQRNAHYGFVQRPAQLFQASQFCVECERPVDRRSHPLGCRAVCGLCLRYDGLQFPCSRRAGEDQSLLRCEQCNFVFPNMECMDAHRQRVDPLPPGGAALMDRRTRREHRSMCEERRICSACNLVVWARTGAHVCRAAPAANVPVPALQNIIDGLQPQQQQQQQQSQRQRCEKCKGPHDPRWTPHFIQPKQYKKQLMNWNGGGGRNDAQNVYQSPEASEGEDEEEESTNGEHDDDVRRAPPKPVRFIFWDAECAQERVDEAPAAVNEAGDDDMQGMPPNDLPLLKHIPLLVCAEVICERCIAYGVDVEHEPMRRAPQCVCGVPWRGVNRHRWCARIGEDLFEEQLEHQEQQQPQSRDGLNPRRLRFFPAHGRGAMEQLVDFLLHTGPYNICTVMLAHNGGRYDIHLLMEELQRRGERPKKCVQHGLRVYMLELSGNHKRRLVVKDSLNYFHCALAALPAIFGMQNVPAKPYFPYNFIHQQNLDVELAAGTLPPASDYDPDRMRPEQRAEFLQWYTQELRRPGRQCFQLRRELLRYCWNGCKECYPQRQMPLSGGRTAELLCARTEMRAWELSERHGMEVMSVWECELKRMMRTNPRVRKLYVEKCCADIPGPLDLRRHALFGGRVEPFYLLYACGTDEELVYIDIVSLYPYCMKMRSFPVGTPHVWTRDQLWPQGQCDDNNGPPQGLRPAPLPWHRAEHNPFKGFILCRVLPPTPAELGEREPLLPYRTHSDGRLIFGLCRRCAEQQQQGRCRHRVSERCWTYAYTHAELNRALDMGYRVLDVHEVWHYDNWTTLDDGLFTSYVNNFLKLKAEASGWPAGCDSAEQRAEHVRRFREENGVELRPELVRKNPGLRQLAKDLLNSLWGKMAERPERDNVEYTTTAREFHDLLEDSRHDVVSFTHLNEQMDRCVVRKRAPFAHAPEHNNLAVACFVTSYARLCLYEWLEEVRRVGGKKVYCDTDSIIYVKKRGEPGVKEGNGLGDMKRELPGRRIYDFFSAGPKNYGFKHVDEGGNDDRAERKIRSFELNYETSQLLQYERMKQLVVNHFSRRPRPNGRRSIAVPCHRFVRSARADIFTRHNTRVYRPVYTKGRIIRTEREQPDQQQQQEHQEQDHPEEQQPLRYMRTRPFGWYSAADHEEEEE